MGCDIHTLVEVKLDGVWTAYKFEPEIFNWRQYGLFGFLADVRNYSHVPNPWPPCDWPTDVTPEANEMWEYAECWYGHTRHCIGLHSLLSFNYDDTFEDRRCCKPVMTTLAPNIFSGAEDTGEGKGKIVTYREFLTPGYFAELERMRELHVRYNIPQEFVRLVFCFDN